MSRISIESFFTVGFWIVRSLSEKDWVIVRSDIECFIQGVMPDFLHFVPVSDNAAFDGAFRLDDITFRSSLVAVTR